MGPLTHFSSFKFDNLSSPYETVAKTLKEFFRY